MGEGEVRVGEGGGGGGGDEGDGGEGTLGGVTDDESREDEDGEVEEGRGVERQARVRMVGLDDLRRFGFRLRNSFGLGTRERFS